MNQQELSTRPQMQIGIFARTFSRPTLEGVLDAVQAHGIRQIQFDMVCVGLPEMPDEIDPQMLGVWRAAVAARGLSVASLSGTFNMIHPDVAERQKGLRRLGVMMDAAQPLGTSVITVCTGTRDPNSMWRRHPDNDEPDAWRDLLATMGEAVRMAETAGVTLAFEPEVANVVDSAQKARRLLDEIRSPHLKVVFDGANIFHRGELARMHDLLAESVDLLAGDIVLAHAKDLDRDGEAGHLAAGHGLLDYRHYLALLQKAGFAGTILLHGLKEEQVAGCVQFLQGHLDALGSNAF